MYEFALVEEEQKNPKFHIFFHIDYRLKLSKKALLIKRSINGKKEKERKNPYKDCVAIM